MASSTTRRPSWRTVTPALAVAVLGLAGCTNSQESSDVQGTTPAVWTSSAAPAASGHGHGGGHGDEHGSERTAGATAELRDPSGRVAGTVTFLTMGNHVQVQVEANGLKPGFHGLHIHSVGKCEANSVAPTGGAPGNFLSAGGHLQVGGSTGHPASGDLTSLSVRGDGTGSLTTTTDTVTLDEIRGKAVIVHADADNFANIPTRYQRADGATGPDETTLSTGDAGGRVACGVIS